MYAVSPPGGPSVTEPAAQPRYPAELGPSVTFHYPVASYASFDSTLTTEDKKVELIVQAIPSSELSVEELFEQFSKCSKGLSYKKPKSVRQTCRDLEYNSCENLNCLIYSSASGRAEWLKRVEAEWIHTTSSTPISHYEYVGRYTEMTKHWTGTVKTMLPAPEGYQGLREIVVKT